MTSWLKKSSAQGKTIGFVPTMGALHAGHMSLIKASKADAGLTVCSIFINPTQFNDPGDFQRYPVTIEKDIEMLEAGGADVLFLPPVAELYPGGTGGLERYDLGNLENLLEGKYRPGHFQGVCQVMFRLLSLVRPDDLYMGQKDYQQCMVIRRLLEIMRLPARLHPCPIIREQDGLAMSSRNLRLSPGQRSNATAIYRALLDLKEKWAVRGKAAIESAEAILTGADFRVDYVSVADKDSLEPLAPGAARPAVALVAAFQGEVRLIDNMLL